MTKVDEIVVELISTAGAVIGAGKSILQGLEFIRGIKDSSVISAYFKLDGSRIAGSDKIEIEKHPDKGRNDVWWFSVKELQDYTFVRVPVIESCVEELPGRIQGEPNPTTQYWQWVAPIPRGRIANEKSPNILVDFLVVGYRPKALLDHFSS